jgi:hypothetical protein
MSSAKEKRNCTQENYLIHSEFSISVVTADNQGFKLVPGMLYSHCWCLLKLQRLLKHSVNDFNETRGNEMRLRLDRNKPSKLKQHSPSRSWKVFIQKGGFLKHWIQERTQNILNAERRQMVIDKYTGQLTNLLASVNMCTAHAFQHGKIGTSE